MITFIISYNHNLLTWSTLAKVWWIFIIEWYRHKGAFRALYAQYYSISISLFQSYNIYLATPMTYQHTTSQLISIKRCATTSVFQLTSHE